MVVYSVESRLAPDTGAVDGQTAHPRRWPKPATIAVVGLGYVGLPTALALAESGAEVTGYDTNSDRLSAIRSGAVDLGVDDLARLDEWGDSNRLTFTTDPAGLVSAATVIICVPTPVDEHLTPDMRALSAACRTVVDHAHAGQTIVLTSTSYVGCTRDLLVKPLTDRGFAVGEDVFVAFAPERIDPGNTKYPQETVPRVVGGVGSESLGRASAVLGRIAPVHMVSTPESAELCKLVENTFRAVNIAFANEVADIAREVRVDAVEVIDAAATKPFGFMPFYPGPGAGGHCIPCDPHYLLWQLRAHRFDARVIDTVMTKLAARPGQVVSRAAEVLADAGIRVAGARVLVVGVTYKAGVADVRESPALEILERLHQAGAHIAYTDPFVPSLHLQGIDLIGVADPTVTVWDLVVVHTRHSDDAVTWVAPGQLVLDCTYRETEVPTHVL